MRLVRQVIADNVRRTHRWLPRFKVLVYEGRTSYGWVRIVWGRRRAERLAAQHGTRWVWQ